MNAFPMLDEILAVLDKYKDTALLPAERSALVSCQAAVGDAFIDLLGDES